MRNAEAFLASIREHAAGLAKQRSARQRRRNLDPADFDALRVLGLHLATVPVAFGGFWESTAQSLRPLCEAHRILATGDSSVALTASMHPSVLTAWRDATTPNIGAAAWEDQRRQVFQSVVEGAWWGTVNSEPGSGGDLAKTRSVARRDGANYRLTGEKHFGSGSGATSFVQTVAVPDDSSEPAFFFLDVRDAPWDGSTGMKLTAEWDGHGMTSTNSHGFAFDSYPATRVAWPGSWREMVELTGGAGGIIYTSVIVGVVDAAMLYMRNYLIKRGPDTMRSFEKVEWVDAHRETWLLQQALDVRCVCSSGTAVRATKPLWPKPTSPCWPTPSWHACAESPAAARSAVIRRLVSGSRTCALWGSSGRPGAWRTTRCSRRVGPKAPLCLAIPCHDPGSAMFRWRQGDLRRKHVKAHRQVVGCRR